MKSIQNFSMLIQQFLKKAQCQKLFFQASQFFKTNWTTLSQLISNLLANLKMRVKSLAIYKLAVR